MPTSARKSSVGGARRALQKDHVPYRGDNPNVGKKTGIAVQHVERKSDGFEPFEELLQQADGRTPPRRKVRRKSGAAAQANGDYDDWDDGDGEMSMQLDSPVHHLINMRPPTTPTTTGRRSSIRPVARTSEVDFDKIPSPRPLYSAQSRNRSAAGPSSLSKSTHARDIEPDSESENEDAGDYYNDTQMDDGGFNDDYSRGNDDEDDEQENTPTQASVRGDQSFSAMDQDDDEEEEEEEQEPTPEPEPPKPKSTKKKPPPPPSPREPSLSEDEQVEDEIAQGLEDVGLGPTTDEEEEEEAPPPKKTKVAPPKKSPRKTHTGSKKENRPHREGVRRSQREHYAPLEYWRGEKLVYGRSRNTGPILVPQIKEIVRIPREQPEPLGAKRKRASTRPRSRSRAVDDEVIPPALPVVNPEEGWDDDTIPNCTVLNFTTKEEIERRIAWTAKMISPKFASTNTWAFDKVFEDDSFIAAGQLLIPPQGRKSSKAANDNTYVFYIIEGAVNFKIHETSMVLASGAMFMVPRGNSYFIENISNRDAKIFFTQARKMDMNAAERKAKALHQAEAQRRKSLARSSSAAPIAGNRDGATTAARSKSLATSR